MGKTFSRLLTFVCLVSLCAGAFDGGAKQALAQLPRDVQDVFEGMLDDLDADLRAKFEKAIAENTATVTFSRDEFLRFRSNPINPFEDLSNINPSPAETNISLKFELPSLRNRRVSRHERQTSSLLSAAGKLSGKNSASTVSIWKNDRNVAMGIVVTDDGYIITKASEVQKRAPVKCKIDGVLNLARIERVDEVNDVALLKVESDGLQPIQWAQKSESSVGSFVVTTDENGQTLALGTYSVLPRTTVFGEQAFLGVNPERVASGVRISDIKPGEASFEAGLQDGDVITALGGMLMKDVDDLVTAIRSHKPGDTVDIQFLRQGQSRSTKATLAGRNMSGDRAARFKMMNRLGAILSRRNGNFPYVFQHDTPLFPEQCGGPILNLSGEAIGMNIARQGRASSLAIPADRVQQIVTDLMRHSVASKNEDLSSQ